MPRAQWTARTRSSATSLVEMPAEQGPLRPITANSRLLHSGSRTPSPALTRPPLPTCDGAKIHYQSWGDPSKPGLLLVHGNGASRALVGLRRALSHRRLSRRRHDASRGWAISDWRETTRWTPSRSEQLAVCEAAGLFAHAEKPIIVSHSFGGFVTILTGAEYGDRFTGIVIVDSPVNPPDRPRSRPARKCPRQQGLSDAREGALALPPRPAPAVREPLHPRLHRPLVASESAARPMEAGMAGRGSSIPRSGSASPPPASRANCSRKPAAGSPSSRATSR